MTVNAAVDLDPDGAKTPQRTAELAAVAAGALRAMRSALDGEGPATGIGWPVSPQDLAADLSSAAGHGAWICNLLIGQLEAHHRAGGLEAAHGVDVGHAIAAARGHLVEAGDLWTQLCVSLRSAQNALAPIQPRDPRPEELEG